MRRPAVARAEVRVSVVAGGSMARAEVRVSVVVGGSMFCRRRGRVRGEKVEEEGGSKGTRVNAIVSMEYNAGWKRREGRQKHTD